MLRKLRFDKNLPDQTQTVQLGDAKYQLRTYWNERTRQWYLDVATEEGVSILKGDALGAGTFPGSNSLDFPVDLAVWGPELQRMEDLWEGRLRVYYIQPDE